MASTSYPVNHPLAVKLWAKKLEVEALKATSFADFVGTDRNSLIHLKEELQKGPGDQITFGLRMQLTARGVQGRATLEGNEESLTTYSDAVLINKTRHAVRSGSAQSIDAQRITFDAREEALDGLVDWWADRKDVSLFNQLCGYTAETDTIYSGNQATVAPDAAHIFRPNSLTTDQAVQADTTAIFKLSIIDRLVERAKTLSPAIRPIVMGGKKWYVLFLHPYQITDLRLDASTAGNWFDIQQAAIQGGDITENPIFTGALGVYNQTILVENTRVTNGVHSSTGAAQTSVRRAVFCGAQAACLAYGQQNQDSAYTWVEEEFDYGEELGVSAGANWGVKKTRFNSQDFSTLVASTYAAAH